MRYQVLISHQAEKELEKIAKPMGAKIKSAVLALGNNPRPHGCKKLQGRQGYRIRVGNFRIVYDVDNKVVTVYVLTVMDRKDVYRR